MPESLSVFLIISCIIWIVFLDIAAVFFSVEFISDKIKDHRKKRNEKPVD